MAFLRRSCCTLKRRLGRPFGQIAANQNNIVPENDTNSLEVGQKFHGFEIKVVKNIPEFQMKAIFLEHEKTKSEYLHLLRRDPNNVFSINFRTPPKDSSGKPHILEHIVLCGSHLFPVRDPFFKMTNRSLATFMNAMTGSDFTMYPFSSQNYLDYRNLQKVYLDAVFSPLLKELDFLQEGWRLENSNINDIQSDLTIKGIVYNEMKGVFSENENILCQKIQNYILPDDSYGFVSGGDPRYIPDLTWEELKQFHKQHYHPSNCRCFSYGNFPLLPSLQYINDTYFSKYAYSLPTNTLVPKQKRWAAPQKHNVSCRFDNMGPPIEKQNCLSISLLLSDCDNVYDTFLLRFLTELLVKGPNSAFYKSMIESNLCGGFTSSTGLDAQLRDVVFTLGLNGVEKGVFLKVEDLFDITINTVIKRGFNKDHVESVLHNFELSLRHESSNFGLNILFNITPLWNHSSDPIAILNYNALINTLKDNIKSDPEYLQNMVRKYFKDNQHRLTLTMSANSNFELNLYNEEQQVLRNLTDRLSGKDKQMIYDKCLKLQEAQDSFDPKNTELLPSLSMDDVDSDIETAEHIKVCMNNIPTQINKVNCSNIIYFKSILNTKELSEEQHMILPLFCYVIQNLGTNKLNYRDFDNLIHKKTGGIHLKLNIADSLFRLHTYEPGILLTSYCLEHNLESMFDIWNQILNISKLDDVERLKVLTKLYITNLTQGIVDSGHIYAMQAAGGLISASGRQVDLMSGIQHISYMKQLINTKSYDAMLVELLKIAKTLFQDCNKKMRVVLNIPQKTTTDVIRTYENFASNLSSNSKIPSSSVAVNTNFVTGNVWGSANGVNCQHYVLNVPVNFCSKAILTVPFNNSDYAKLKVLAKLLTYKYCLPYIREKQGAYGAGARMSTDGVFSFFSYRDPKSYDTLYTFDNSYEWFKTNFNKISDQDLIGAKLAIFQTVDAPHPPELKGCDEFFKTLTPEMLQRHRAEIMNVNKQDLRDVAEKYLASDLFLKTGKVILGPKCETLETLYKDKNELWTIVDAT